MAKEKPAKPAAAKPKATAPEKPAKAEAKAVKPAAKANGVSEAAPKEAAHKEKPAKTEAQPVATKVPNGKPVVEKVEMTPFLIRQKDKLLQLRDSMLDSMMGVAKDNLRTRAEGSEASAFGMHQADAGSDAYDREIGRASCRERV